MYAVHIKELSGRTQTYNNVNNISVSTGRILLVIDRNKMVSFRPGDLSEVRFCWQGHGMMVKEHYEKLGDYYDNEGSDVND